jgi:Protein of unknown function (DUF1116)
MSAGNAQLGGPPVAVAAGIETIPAEVEAQGADVIRVEWQPPQAAAALERLATAAGRTAAANDEACGQLQAAKPVLAGLARAEEVVPGLDRGTLLHAGPPIVWERMCGPMRGAIVGALLYEELATSAEEAEGIAARGEVELRPCHDHGAVGPMAGVVSASMPVWIVENENGGNRAYSTLNEGLGRVLRYGAYDDEVIERLRWMRDVLAPSLASALERTEPRLDLRVLIAQALQMGDEVHNRNRAATSLLIRALAPALAAEGGTQATQVLRFLDDNDHFFLNLAMAAAKATADSAAGVGGSSIVTAMARNGVEFGIRVSGTGERWFTGPAGEVEGLYFSGYGPEDANPDIGDSSITETVGLGGFSMAAAPAIVRFVGGTPEKAIETSREMYEISWSESEAFQLPALGFRGAPLGIDARAVAQTGTLPRINTGVAHREPGVGQVGAGLVEPPMEAFVAAVEALAEESA